MKLLISGEGPSDLGSCNNAQGLCCDGDFSRGPMAVWLVRLWEDLLNYNLMDIPESVIYVSEHTLAQKAKNSPQRMKRQRGKKQEAETGLFFSNARHLGLMAQELSAGTETPVMAVLFRDADGTRSAPGKIWQTKWKSIIDGFASVAFDFGVPMVPQPKSEVWLLSTTKQEGYSHAALEDISGNDESPNSAKAQLDSAFGGHQSAAQLSDWCENYPKSWEQLQTIPSFKEFFDRFHEVAELILRPTAAQRNEFA